MENLNTRQLKIYRFIRKFGPVANKQIKEYLEKFSDDVSRMTITRDLDGLILNKLIEKIGEGRSVVYKKLEKNNISLYVDPEEYYKEDPDERILISETFNFEVFGYLTDDLIIENELLRLEKLNDKYQKRLPELSPGLIKKEIERLAIELSWKSSKIEGNTYSLLDTEALIKEQVEAVGHSKLEATMILNHKKAFDYIYNNKEAFKEVSVAKIEELHSLVVGGLEIERNIRKRLVRITGTKYKPIDNEFQIREALQDLCDFINKKDIHPLSKAMMTILLISYIQPFEDGNKRTARLLGNAIMHANNYCPLSYRSVDVTEYKKATLLFYEQNNISYFKKLFIEQFEFAVENYFG